MMDKEKKKDYMNTLYWAVVLGLIGEMFSRKPKPEPEIDVKPERKQLPPDRENGGCSIGCGIFLLIAGICTVCNLDLQGILVCILGIVLWIFGRKLLARSATGEQLDIAAAKKNGGNLLWIGALLLWITTLCDLSGFTFILGIPGAFLLLLGMKQAWWG